MMIVMNEIKSNRFIMNSVTSPDAKERANVYSQVIVFIHFSFFFANVSQTFFYTAYLLRAMEKLDPDPGRVANPMPDI